MDLFLQILFPKNQLLIMYYLLTKYLFPIIIIFLFNLTGSND